MNFHHPPHQPIRLLSHAVCSIDLFLSASGRPTGIAGSEIEHRCSAPAGIPIEDYFGILPLITGSIIITIGATLISVPFGLATAIYIAEIAPRWMREILKPACRVAGRNSLRCTWFPGHPSPGKFSTRLDEPSNRFDRPGGSLLLAAVAVPTVVSVAEDALDAVPRSYREGAWALGATPWQTIWRVTLPAAKSGVLTAIMLGWVVPSARPWW